MIIIIFIAILQVENEMGRGLGRWEGAVGWRDEAGKCVEMVEPLRPVAPRGGVGGGSGGTRTMAQAKTAISPTRGEDFPEWYQQVVRAAEGRLRVLATGTLLTPLVGFSVPEEGPPDADSG